MKKLLLCLILTTIGNGCATFVDSPIGIPPRPTLVPLPIEMQHQIPVDALDIIAVNDAALKHHIRRLEGRISVHDESL